MDEGTTKHPGELTISKPDFLPLILSVDEEKAKKIDTCKRETWEG